MSEVMALPDSIVARPLRLADAQAVFELTRAADLYDTGHSMVELEDINGDWARPSYDLSAQSIGYLDGGTLVAYAEVHRKRREGYVHPSHRGRGIGTAMFDWSIAKARDLGYDRVGQTVPVTNLGAIELFKRHGSELLWNSWILELPEDAPILDEDLPAHHRMRLFEAERDARDVYQTIEDAFNEWPNREASTFEDWRAFTLDRADFEPWQVITVVEEVGGVERIVGGCKVSTHEGVGWVDQIAVRHESRGQGLGRALLGAAFAQARAHGATTSRLNTDSRTGALGLYEHVGMVVVETYQHFALDLS